MNQKERILSQIAGGLIVSCQALADEPLHSSYIMSRMAVAAKEGGCCAIRANSTEDILAIRKAVNLPTIGLIKSMYDDSEVYITPTQSEVEELVCTDTEIIAVDATQRQRPGGQSLEEFFLPLREKYPDILFMADCSTVDEGVHAAELGFDLVGTTLAGYTEYTKGVSLPAIDMMREMVQRSEVPVIAEGGIWSPEDLKNVFEAGVHAAVVGTAITRPREITQRFVNALPNRTKSVLFSHFVSSESGSY